MRECETQGRGVGFSFRSVFATDAGGKIISQPEFPELLADSRTVSAGDDSQHEFALERANHFFCARHQARILPLVSARPEPVCFVPFPARQASRAIDAIPIRRIVAREIVESPIDAEGLKHREVGARIRGVGIYEGAVPVKQNGASRESPAFH